jgi:outer membrane protein assembly factor BamB
METYMTTSRRMAVATLSLITTLWTSTGCQANDWPKFLGTNGTGISAETGINKDWTAKPPKELWRAPMTDAGYSGPAVANGLVYLIDHKDDAEIIRALDLNTGTEKWRHTFAEPGKENMGFTRSTPTVENGVVYTVSRYGTVTALDAASGTLKWSVNPVKAHNGTLPEWEISSSPVIDGDKLIAIAGGENSHVVALDKKTGKEIWAGGGTDKPGYATPVVATVGGAKQYVVFTGKNLIGVAAADGKVLWTYPWKTQYDVNAATPILLDNNRLLISSGYRTGMTLLQIGAAGVTEVWKEKNRRIALRWSSPVVLNGFIYCITEPGYLACLDLATGEEKWRSKGADETGFEYGGLCAVDGTLLAVSGNTCNVIQAKAQPDAYQELGKINPFKDGKNCWVAPVVAGKKLLVRSPSELVCLDLTP